MCDEFERTSIDTSKIRIPEYVKRYKVVRTIGSGGFSVVVLGVHQKTGEKVAIKIMDRKEITKQKVFSYLENELRLISRFNHPNIVKVFDIIYEEDVIMIIMEYLRQGDLQKVISSGITFTLSEQISITRQLLDALTYLHKRGIAHRDIKPENILFDENFHPKLIDFGLSRENPAALHTLCGTSLYLAPEVVTSSEYDGRKSDVWAMGIVIHIIAALAFPFDIASEVYHLKRLAAHNLNFDIKIQGILGTIVKNCLVYNENERPSAEYLLNLVDGECKRPLTCHISQMPQPKKKTSLPLLLSRNNTPVLIPKMRHHDKSPVNNPRKAVRHFSNQI